MKNLKDFITESSIITESKNECEVLDAGTVGNPDPRGTKFNVSDKAKWMEIAEDLSWINFYDETDIEVIIDEMDDSEAGEIFYNLKYGESTMTPDGNILIRIRK